MKCKKCGSEIKDGKLFCVNCGTSIESNKVEEKNAKKKETKKDNNAKKATKNKFKIIIPIIAMTVVLIVIGAVIFLNINNTNISNKQEQEQGIENSKVELGVNYNVVSDGQEVKSVTYLGNTTKGRPTFSFTDSKGNQYGYLVADAVYNYVAVYDNNYELIGELNIMS